MLVAARSLILHCKSLEHKNASPPMTKSLSKTFPGRFLSPNRLAEKFHSVNRISYQTKNDFVNLPKYALQPNSFNLSSKFDPPCAPTPFFLRKYPSYAPTIAPNTLPSAKLVVIFST